MDKFSLEVKVGLVVTAAVGLVLAFIFILGDWNPFSNTYRLIVSLDYAGGIKPGSDVDLAGAKVGKVDSIRFPKELSPSEPPLQLELLIDKRAKELIRKDSKFSVEMESLLGGKIVEITPGSPSAAALEDGAVVRGIEPPNLDALIGEAVELVNGLKDLMGQLTAEDKERLRGLLVSVSRLGPEDVDNVKRLLQNGADASEDLKAMSGELRPQMPPLLADLRTSLDEAGPTLKEARALVAKMNRTVDQLRAMAPTDSAATRAKIEELINTADQLSRLADRLDRFTAYMEREYGDIDRAELERIIREFLQQQGITVNVGTITGKPHYPPPPPAARPATKKETDDGTK
jgi:phospholipid/cholesterol/gamma-HCH transport system substrate-binding protein